MQALYDALESGLLGAAPRLIAPAGGPARHVLALVGLDGLVPVVDR